jgi:hypothetical protein
MPIETLGCRPEDKREEDPSDSATAEKRHGRWQVGQRAREGRADESAEEQHGGWG